MNNQRSVWLGTGTSSINIEEGYDNDAYQLPNIVK